MNFPNTLRIPVSLIDTPQPPPVAHETAVSAKHAQLTCVLVGNPNAGKTCIFNSLTGSHQRVANYPGVTVSVKEGTVRHADHTFTVIDLPGTYSLSAYSIEEMIVQSYLLDQKPDVVINVVDATNLERNLYLTTQLIELGLPTVVALNMSDEAREQGTVIDHEKLGQLLGVPFVPTVGPSRIAQYGPGCCSGNKSCRPPCPR